MPAVLKKTIGLILLFYTVGWISMQALFTV